MGALLLALALAAAPATQQRCGWLINPTPANWTLRDRQAEWTLSEQGGYVAKGFDDLPEDLKSHGWVVTNGGAYGYGCACVSGTFDPEGERAVSLRSARPRPLAVCRADRTLPKVR